MYIVRNLSKRTIIIADLRIEIGPHKILDLELMADRNAIDKSPHVRQALRNKQLSLVKRSVVKSRYKVPVKREVEIQHEVQVIEKQINKTVEAQINEEKLTDLITKVLDKHADSNQPKAESSVDEQKIADLVTQAMDKHTPKETDIESSVQKIMGKSVDNLMDSIRDRMNSLPIGRQNDDNAVEVNIDPQTLAGLKQKAIDKISDDIETSRPKAVKKVKLKTKKNISDLADGL